MLTSEVSVEKIFISLIGKQEFCARLHDPRIYYELTQRVINRYAYPITLDFMK